MRNVGIDIAKDTVAVHIPPGEAFTATNDPKGFRQIRKRLQAGDVLAVESTSVYHHQLALFFLRAGFEVKEINPIMTKQFIRATVRKKKTDKSDALILSRLLDQDAGYGMTEKNILNPVKKRYRVRKKLVQMRSSLKIQRTTLGSCPAATGTVKKAFDRLIKSMDKEIEGLEAELLQTEGEEIRILESVPGISPISARGIFAEIGDVHRFVGKKQLVAFAGYDPKLSESGSSVYHSGKLTKRGSPALRNALHWAALANIRLDTPFSRYYHKKVKEGKKPIQAMTATSRKILEVIYFLLQKQELFKKT